MARGLPGVSEKGSPKTVATLKGNVISTTHVVVISAKSEVGEARRRTRLNNHSPTLLTHSFARLSQELVRFVHILLFTRRLFLYSSSSSSSLFFLFLSFYFVSPLCLSFSLSLLYDLTDFLDRLYTAAAVNRDSGNL